MTEGRPKKESTLVDPALGAVVSRSGPGPTDTLSPSGRQKSATEPELPATELGSYRLLQWLGGGGMGQVFLAEHRQLGRKVALKVLRRELAHTPEVVRRFVHEAQLVNQIKNEHIVDIHDFGEGPDGLEYFVMELLVGRDLARAREEGGPFPLARTLDVIRQIGSALEAVHSHKIIHRDLKPENIFLAERGEQRDFVKLLDFGLAKLTEAAPGAADGTAVGTLIGTPLYMSPEQAMGLRVDWRTDIFSLGLVFYWMLFDRLPHEGEDLESIRQLRMDQPVSSLPPVTASGEAVPAAVAQAVVGCLVRNPRERLQTVAEVLARLPVPAPLLPPELPARASLRRPLVAAGAGMALAAAGLAVYLSRQPAPEVPVLLPAAAAHATLPPLPVPAAPPATVLLPELPRPPAVAAEGPPAGAKAAPAEPPRKRARPPRRRDAATGTERPDQLIDPFDTSGG